MRSSETDFPPTSARRFHHGGRIGDLVYAMYTIKALGGGELCLSLFHHPGWDRRFAESVKSLAEYQDYINQVSIIDIDQRQMSEWRCGRSKPWLIEKFIDYDLHDAELDYNPHMFPEWHKRDWPGNCHIAKRYAVHFGVDWDPEAVWLEAPQTHVNIDVVFHMPLRRSVRSKERWLFILRALKASGFTVLVMTGPYDYEEWNYACEMYNIPCIVPSDMLDASDYINSSRLFIGGASSCNTIAEGLKKRRIVELADGCDDTYPYGLTGWCATDMPDEDLLNLAESVLE